MYIRLNGAINSKTGIYTPPFLANKANKYDCYMCKTRAKFNKGPIKEEHFSHITKNDCTCFEVKRYIEPKPTDIITSEIDELEKQKRENESDFHKEGKKTIKALLEDGYELSFRRYCKTRTPKCSNVLIIRPDMICNNSKIELEYHMKHNDKSIYCDIAHLVGGEVKMIYEIFYTHRTADHDRPNNINWVDIEVKHIYERIINNEDKNDKKLLLTCSRYYECEECKQYIIQREEERKEKEDEERILRIVKLEMERENHRFLEEEKKKQMMLKIQQEKEKQIMDEEERIKNNILKLEKEKQIREQEEKNKILKLEKDRENQRLKEEEKKKEIIRLQKETQNRELKEHCGSYFKLWYLKTQVLRGSAKSLYMYKLKKHLNIYDYLDCCPTEKKCKLCVSYRYLYKDFFSLLNNKI